MKILHIKVLHVLIRGIEGSDYINASFIDGYRYRNAYIATQVHLHIIIKFTGNTTTIITTTTITTTTITTTTIIIIINIMIMITIGLRRVLSMRLWKTSGGCSGSTTQQLW